MPSATFINLLFLERPNNHFTYFDPTLITVYDFIPKHSEFLSFCDYPVCLHFLPNTCISLSPNHPEIVRA